MDIFGAGRAVADESLTQLIQTNQGVRSQVAGVMGGGTSINMAIIAMESEEYFSYLNSNHGWTLDLKLIDEVCRLHLDHLEAKIGGFASCQPRQLSPFCLRLLKGLLWFHSGSLTFFCSQAHRWVSRAFSPMPQDVVYGSRLSQSLQDQGYLPFKPSDKRAMKTVDPVPTSGLAYSDKLVPGYVWGGVTIFDKKKGFFRNSSDVFLYEAPSRVAHSGRLVLKAGKFVEKLMFDTPTATTPRAVCVKYRSTTREDMAPLGRDTVPKSSRQPAQGLLDYLIGYASKLLAQFWSEPESHEIACVRNEGEIILSAGAIHSPLILFRSGVGPREQLREIGVDEVKAIEHLGRNLTDRVLIPIQMFQKEKKKKEERIPRVCQVLGMRHHGPSCQGVGVNERTLKCSLVTTEELSGPNIIHGLLWASHLLLPPSWRDHPAAHAVFSFVRNCEGKLKFKGTPEYPPACVFAEGLLDCLDRSFSLFYFTTEPKSRGYIRQHRDGRVEVEANYLKDEQDLFDAVRGVQSLIQQVNGGRFDDIVEPLQPGSCPVMMLHTVVELFLRFAQADDLPQYEKQLLSVRRHKADLQPFRQERRSDLPSPADSLRASGLEVGTSHVHGKKPVESNQEPGLSAITSSLEGLPGVSTHRDADLPSVQGFEEALGRVFAEKEKVKKLFEEGREIKQAPAPKTHGPSALSVKRVATSESQQVEPSSCNLNATEDCEGRPVHSELFSTTCMAHDIFNARYGSPCGVDDMPRTTQPDSVDDIGDWHARLMEEGLENFFRPQLPAGSAQSAATYPPILPRPDDPEAVAAFAVTYMTSIWHFAGTAAMGLVVDEEFRVKGIKGLSIADASVLNQMTRLNPTATLLTLGRYIGLMKASPRASSTPHPATKK
ncbi:gmc oxidoreductase [Cystoisospora suis]|uniref:Gmc oxidoreductase n=1 Tax=Cystoisospora suis TaxID=483139 RepID=A0A2C6L5V6_9APIC|nr:gmc oxidoreductase [Cystoisospora suis]